MLTVTGKPRRDRVRSKFLREMQNVYSALSIAHTVVEGESQSAPTPTASAPLLSPYPQSDPAPAPSSSVRVTDPDLDLALPGAVMRSPSQPSMLVADSALLVASLSAYWGSSSHARQVVTVRLPAVLELSCSLQAPFSALVMSLSLTVGPPSVAQVTNHDISYLAIFACSTTMRLWSSPISPYDFLLLTDTPRVGSLSAGVGTWCRGEKPVCRCTRGAVQAAAGGRRTTWGSASSVLQGQTARS